MHFVNEPTVVEASPMEIIVVGAKQRVDAVILTASLAGVQTHWYGGRTIACCGTDNCPACQSNFAPVWKGYMVAYGMKSGNKAILMVTGGAYENLGQHVQHENGLFGLRVVISRAGTRRNSPMTLATFGRCTEYPQYPDKALFAMVRRIFAENANRTPDKAA